MQAATPVTDSASPPAAQRSRIPKVGIIGAGWGARVQLPKFREQGFEVTALWSRGEEKAKEVCAREGIGHAFFGDDTTEICTCPDVDLVSIVGPAHRRGHAVSKALQAEKHILCEKPIACNYPEAKEIAKRVQTITGELNNTQVCLVDFELRCVPALRELRDLILTANLIGNVNISVSFTSLRNFAWMQPGVKASHWHYRQTGGGCWSAIGIHYVDLVRFLFSEEIQKVSAIQRPMRGIVVAKNGDVPSADGMCQAMLVTGRKKISIQMTINGFNPGLPEEVDEMVICSPKATIRFDFLTSELVIYKNPPPDTATPMEKEMETKRVIKGEGNAWQDVGTPALMQRVRAFFEKDDKNALLNMATFQDGLRAQLITDAIHQSAANDGEWAEVTV